MTSAQWESASPDANADDGRMTSANDKQGRGGRGIPHTTNNQEVAAIAVETAVVAVAVAANDDIIK